MRWRRAFPSIRCQPESWLIVRFVAIRVVREEDSMLRAATRSLGALVLDLALSVVVAGEAAARPSGPGPGNKPNA